MRAGWIRSAVLLQKCVVRLRPSEQSERYLAFLRQVRAMRGFSVEDGGSADYKVVVINRRKDKERMEFFRDNMFRLGVPFERHEAFDALDKAADFGPFRDIIGERFCGGDSFPRGTLGCFLSHYTAWQDLVRSGDQMRFICEDDAFILGPLPRSSKAFGLPPDADFVFFNQRMGERMSWVSPLLRAFRYVEVQKALEVQCVPGQPLGAPGLDGYMLTKKGAKKLLEKIRREKFCVDIDWFVLFSSLSKDSRKALLEKEGSKRFDFYESNNEIQINSYVALPIFVEQVEFETTIRRPDKSALIKRSEVG